MLTVCGPFSLSNTMSTFDKKTDRQTDGRNCYISIQLCVCVLCSRETKAPSTTTVSTKCVTVNCYFAIHVVALTRFDWWSFCTTHATYYLLELESAAESMDCRAIRLLSH